MYALDGRACLGSETQVRTCYCALQIYALTSIHGEVMNFQSRRHIYLPNQTDAGSSRAFSGSISIREHAGYLGLLLEGEMEKHPGLIATMHETAQERAEQAALIFETQLCYLLLTGPVRAVVLSTSQ